MSAGDYATGLPLFALPLLGAALVGVAVALRLPSLDRGRARGGRAGARGGRLCVARSDRLVLYAPPA